MRNPKSVFWGIIAILILLWLASDASIFRATTFMAIRESSVQLTGIVAMGSMSLAMILALRPRWPEAGLGGLDKMYRLHKWLGIAALVSAVLHWSWAKMPKWAASLGLIERRAHGPRPIFADPVQALLAGLRGNAEEWGEWAFYAGILLIALALAKSFPYRLFHKTHRLLAIAYLVLVFHAVVLVEFAYWATPIGWTMALLLACGSWAALVVLLRRVGAGRQVDGRIVSLQYYPGVKALETGIKIARGWPGHRAGQFAFAMSDPSEGAHPYTIASGWNPENPNITFIAKELGDHTRSLREKLAVGKSVRVEGPYGCFTFDDDCPRQIWIGGGIGITPFIARMKHMSMLKGESGQPAAQTVDLFHSTADVDDSALEKLEIDARAANVRLHVLIDAHDGLLTGERIRETVPQWREASLWFCGPAGFGAALRRDFAAHGFPVRQRFHQEFFEMR